MNARCHNLKPFLQSHPHRQGILVSPGRKFIYMKAGKTAGTSIYRRTLQERVPDIIHLKDHPALFESWLERISDEELRGYYIFAVVRNPWDRLVSVASYLKVSMAKMIGDFDELQSNEDIRTHSLPCSLYTHFNGIQFVDRICCFSRVQADFNLVCDEIGIERIGLPQANRSAHRHYTTYYSPGERDWVADRYADDIKYFGYVFEVQDDCPPGPPIEAVSSSSPPLLERLARIWKRFGTRRADLTAGPRALPVD